MDQKWEYLLQNLGGIFKSVKLEEVNDALNAMGADGWEVIACFYDNNTDTYRVIAKRPLTDRVRRARSLP